MDVSRPRFLRTRNATPSCVDTTTRKRRGSVFVLSFLGVRLCYDEEVKETHGGESSPEGEREGRCDIASAIKGTNHQM